ncbi:MAG TPA: hypothetical protein VKT82_22840, partial [Ktedonobacterales bacterium]|nr:hypothetical protein [Ktedonobacterales bacterium]
PEQFGTTQTTPRSDIYSLGATLHQVLSGKDPSLNTPFLWDFAPLQVSAPNGLDALVMQMVKLRMDERPASIADVQVQLQRMSGDLTAQQKSPWADTPKAAAPARVFPFAPAQPPSPPRFQPERSRRKALGVYVLLSLLLLGMLVWGGNTLATALEHAQPHAAVSPDPKGTPPAPTATQTPTSVPRATPTDTPLPQPKQAVFVAPTSFGFSSSNCTPSSDGLDVQCVVTVGETADSQAPLSWSMSDSPGAGTFICSEDTSNETGTLSPGQTETVTIRISCTPRCGIILHFSVQGPQNTALTTYTSC